MDVRVFDAEEGLPELVVHDEPQPCPYLPGQVMIAPLRMPLTVVPAEVFDARLASGDRRIGPVLYRTNCEGCKACEPIRVDVDAFRPSATQRRILRAGRTAFSVSVQEPSATPEKYLLYQRHKIERGLEQQGESREPESYEAAFVRSCVDSFEVQVRDRADDRLVAVSIVDRGADALSAVYCYWDPRDSRRSPGAYAILREIELCKSAGMRWLYLGLYVGDCRHMRYKAVYLPHERLIDGAWVRFEK